MGELLWALAGLGLVGLGALFVWAGVKGLGLRRRLAFERELFERAGMG